MPKLGKNTTKLQNHLSSHKSVKYKLVAGTFQVSEEWGSHLKL